jgi:hypothetical protein
LSQPNQTTLASLDDRAEQFSDILMNRAADEQGVIRAVMHFDELRPLRDSDMTGLRSLATGKTPAGFVAYEDAGMTTGAYLSSQCLRYSATGDERALANARRAFDGICHIYELGRAHRRAGFFPKPYDRKASDEVSRDQYLFVFVGLRHYYALADAATQNKIERIVASMADFWIDANYTAPYFDLPPASHLDDFMGSLFLGIIGMAASMTDERRFQVEYDRLYNDLRLGERMNETLRAQFLAGQTYDGSTYYRQQENPIAMKTMAIDQLWDIDSQHRDVWRDALRAFYNDDLLVLLDEQTGMNHFIAGFDPRENRVFMTEPGVIDELTNPLDLPLLTWGGLRKHAGSSKVAYSAAVIAERADLPQAADVARNVLTKLELPCFRGLTVPDESHIPPGDGWMRHALQSCYLAYWQWAYWHMRARGLW